MTLVQVMRGNFVGMRRNLHSAKPDLMTTTGVTKTCVCFFFLACKRDEHFLASIRVDILLFIFIIYFAVYGM